jgi:uncharacterized repeat protein (TIGR01451 family)
MTRRWTTLVLVLAAAAGGALLPGAERAGAAFPGANGKIVFTGFDGESEIFTMQPDGSEVTQLTANGANDAQAAWSPDGTRIAFVSTRDGEAEIFVMNADGSDQTQLTSNVTPDNYPAWSPDGNKLTFTRDVDPDPLVPDFEIFVMNADGSGQAQLTADDFVKFGSEWSPDGARIAFHRGQASGGVEIVVMNADGSGATSLSPSVANDFDPSWSPDGTKIAFWNASVNAISTMNVDGSARTQLATGHEPVWSPDGTKLAFVRVEDGTPAIFVMNADGSGQTRLRTVLGGPLGATLLRPDWQPLVTPTAFADLALTLEPSGKNAHTKKPFAYTITVENNGPATAAGVTMTDVLDPNARFSSVITSRGACTAPAVGSSGSVTCDLGQLPVSETAEITIVVELPSRKDFGTAKPELANTAAVGGSTVDTVVGNNAVTLVTGVVGP